MIARSARKYWLTTILLLAGCAAPLTVDKVAEHEIDKNNKNLVVLTNTRHMPDIRRALAKKGFKVKKFSSVRKIERTLSDTEKETFRQAEGRYGLDVYLGERVDYCIINDAIKYGRVTFEITDLRTNDVLLVVESGGWTKTCAYHPGDLWPDLAQGLADAWQ